MLQGRDLSNTKFQINSLDGLRGLAVLIVFLSHTSNRGASFLSFTKVDPLSRQIYTEFKIEPCSHYSGMALPQFFCSGDIIPREA